MSGFSTRNCPKCGKPFTYIRNPICRECQEEEDAIFETVRQYLKENGDKTLEEVAEATDVSVKKILRYIKEGKIDISNNENITGYCEKCNAPINAGRYCDSCAKKLTDSLNKSFSKPESSAPAKPKSVMYTQQNK